MSLKLLIKAYAAYNLHANQQLVSWLKTQPEALLLQPAASSFPGITQTLNHIWAIEEIWCADLFKNNDAVNRYGVQNLQPHEVLDGLLHRSARLISYTSNLNEQDLNERLAIKTPWFEANLTLAEYLLHLFNHSTYHRGQVIAMAHSIKITGMPATDFLFFAISPFNQ